MSTRHREKSSDILFKIFTNITTFVLLSLIPTLFFYLYGLFNDFSNFSLRNVYFLSVDAYFIGAMMFEFVIKPRSNKTGRNPGI